MLQIAFDIGGTFTDFALCTPEGRVEVWKVSTTPAEPSEAVVSSLAERIRSGALRPADVGGMLHATTIATNAILERKGARTALVTTQGFRDILLIGRQKRYDTNSLHLEKPRPLIQRRDIFELPERMTPSGAVAAPLDEAAATRIARQIATLGYRSVAIVLLHAYANDAHERRMAEILAQADPALRISLSSVVSPKFREYERTNTTVANAYVAPMVEGYLNALKGAMAELGTGGRLSVMQSNGGLVSPELATTYPIRIVESGPAAGVLMSAEVGREEGCANVMSFDMGGTTAKLGAVDGGVPAVTPSFEVDAVAYRRGSGLPLSIMAIELLEIGAGGGSIARTKMGLITVGPDSAGAVPGPICYGRGGAEPTITDANLVLGYLNPASFNAGTMRLDSKAAEAGIERAIGRPLGLGLHEAAWGIHSIANSNMERAMRIVSIERGRDPRRYALVAFGGAGPLHACRLARRLEIPRVVVPRGAGVGSALGLLVAERRIDLGLTRVLLLDDTAGERVAAIFAELEQRILAEARRLDPSARVRIARSASMHYLGQGYEIRVDLPDGPVGPDFEVAARRAFHETYQREFGFSDPAGAVEVTDWYVVATLVGSRASDTLRLESPASGGTPVVDERLAYFPEAGGMTPCPVLDRYALTPAHRFTGPLMVEERESTTVVLPGDTVTVSTTGNLIVEIGRVVT